MIWHEILSPTRLVCLYSYQILLLLSRRDLLETELCCKRSPLDWICNKNKMVYLKHHLSCSRKEITQSRFHYLIELLPDGPDRLVHWLGREVILQPIRREQYVSYSLRFHETMHSQPGSVHRQTNISDLTVSSCLHKIYFTIIMQVKLSTKSKRIHILVFALFSMLICQMHKKENFIFQGRLTQLLSYSNAIRLIALSFLP